MDVVRIGADDADKLLIVSSGCHGVEGYCGSGAQVALLHDETFRAKARHAGVALLFIHALNPWGFSFGRRVTHEGVDLNRNFVDFPPSAARQSRLRPARRLPAAGAVAAERRQRAPADGLRRGARHGRAAGGRLGRAVQPSRRRVLRRPSPPRGASRRCAWCCASTRPTCRLLGWIDLHSGLGESGVGERIFSAREDDGAKHRAKAWWGNRITFTNDGSSTSSDTHGNLWQAVYDECAQADYAGIALEFGTQPTEVVLQALRHDHWVARRRDPHDEHREPARAAMRHAFFTDTPEWKQAVLTQTRAAAVQAIDGMAGWR